MSSTVNTTHTPTHPSVTATTGHVSLSYVWSETKKFRGTSTRRVYTINSAVIDAVKVITLK